MQSTQSENYITLRHNNADHNLSRDEYTRWICLLEGIDIVDKKMHQFGRRLKNESVDWIKPLAFQKYITERFETMKCDLDEIDKNKEKFDFNVTSNFTPVCTTSPEPALQ